MSITVYTVILDGYDNLRPPAVIEPGVRYVCFSDTPQRCDPWEIQPAYRPYRDNGRDSRIPKILTHLFIDTEYSIYHDGCLVMTASPSVLVSQFLDGADIAMYPHPCRRSVYEEMDCCARFGIGYGPTMEAQSARYREHGLRDELWAGGVVIRRHTEIVQLFNESWWREFRDGCSRDQFALAFARYSVGLKVGVIPGDILQDAVRFQFCFHAAFTEAGDNPQFAEAQAIRARRLRQLEALL